MQCHIMIYTHNNDMTHHDVTMNIHSNGITYCDVTMGHGTKKQKSIVHYVIPQNVLLRPESPLEI